VGGVQEYLHQEEIDHEEGFRKWSDGMLALASLAMAVLDTKVEGVKTGEASKWIVEGMMVVGSGLLGLGLDEVQIKARGFESFCEGIRSFVVFNREEGLKGTFKAVERLKNIMDHWDMPKIIDQEENEGNETEGDIDIDEEHPGFRWINRPAVLTIGNVRMTSDESFDRYPGEQHDNEPSCDPYSVDLSSGSESSSVDEF